MRDKKTPSAAGSPQKAQGDIGREVSAAGSASTQSGNLFHDNLEPDLYTEVDHGPFLVDNNVFLCRDALFPSDLAWRSLCP